MAPKENSGNMVQDPRNRPLHQILSNQPVQPGQPVHSVQPVQSSTGDAPSIPQPFGELPEDFDFEAAALEFGPLPDLPMADADLNYQFTSIPPNNSLGADADEALNAKTPGYNIYDPGNTYGAAGTPTYQPPGQPQIGFQPYTHGSPIAGPASHTPIHQNPFDVSNVKTPYVPPSPIISSGSFENNGPGAAISALESDSQDHNGLDSYVPPPSPLTALHTSDPSGIVASSPASAVSSSMPPPKTKATPRSKGKGKAKAVEEEQDEDFELDDTPLANKGKGKGRKKAAAAKTPTQGRRRSTRVATKTASKAAKDAAESLATMGQQRVRQPAKNGIVKHKAIPDSFEECDEADQMLIKWREAEREWPEINAEYTRLGGVQYGNSSLPNRYARLKDNFTKMPDELVVHLFDAKDEIEKEFHGRKWDLIAASFEEKCGAKFTPEELKLRFKVTMQKEGHPVNKGLARTDVDYVMENPALNEDEDPDNDMIEEGDADYDGDGDGNVNFDELVYRPSDPMFDGRDEGDEDMA